MNTTQLAVGMTVTALANNEHFCITKNKGYILVKPKESGWSIYKHFSYIDDEGDQRHLNLDKFDQYFTTTPPDQKIKQQALAQCDEALKLNSQIGNFGKPNDKDNKPDQEGGSSGLLNGFNDGLHRSSGIGGQSPELSTLDQEGKREEAKGKSLLQELIEELEVFKNTRCKSMQEVIFFDGVLAIIESKYLQREYEQASQLQSRVKELEAYNRTTERLRLEDAASAMNEQNRLHTKVNDLKGHLEAAEKHIEIITRERDWQTDVVVPDLDQQIASLKQENERLKGGESKIDVKKLEEQLDAFLSKQSPEQLREWMELNSKGSPTAPTNDSQTDK